LYNVIKGVTVNYDSQAPFVVETVLEDKSHELTEEQDLIVRNEINRRLRELEKNTEVITGGMINKAQSEVDTMLEQARRESAMLFEEKRREAFETGTREAEQKYSVILENSNDLIEKEKATFEEAISRMSDDILDLAIEMAQKIIKIEFDRNDKAILNALSRVIEDYKNEKKLIVELSAKNLEILKNHELAKKYEFRENKVLGEKDALIEVESGIIDISMDKQLENLATAMKEI